MTDRLSIVGAGSWGTALAVLMVDKGIDVTLWGFEADQVEEMISKRENVTFLPGVHLPDGLKVTNSLSEALEASDLVVMAIPSHPFREVCRNSVATCLDLADKRFVSVAKGIERDTLMRMSEIILEEVQGLAPTSVTVLSGPSHAEEVARQIPTAVVAASENPGFAAEVQKLFMTSNFRVYTSTDVVGTEVGAAIKNIIALASGICDGVGYGDNTKAALMTRGLAEATRLGLKMGARAETFAGLSGMGDLIVTCMSRHSRNRFVGQKIGEGMSLQEVLDQMQMVAEGVHNTVAARQLAAKHKVEMPIVNAVHGVLFEGNDPKGAVEELMNRSAKLESVNDQVAATVR